MGPAASPRALRDLAGAPLRCARALGGPQGAHEKAPGVPRLMRASLLQVLLVIHSVLTLMVKWVLVSSPGGQVTSEETKRHELQLLTYLCQAMLGVRNLSESLTTDLRTIVGGGGLVVMTE